MNEPLPDDGVVRKLWPAEAAAYRDHLLRLDRESRNTRFSGAVSDEFIDKHAHSISDFGVIVYGFFVDGALRGAGELRPVGPLFSHEAEAAFSIEKDWQSHGVGTALLERILLSSRNRGIRLLRMDCLAGNRRMQQLARKFEADFTFDFGSIVGEVRAPRYTALSLALEAVEDAHGIATSLLDAQMRLFKVA